MGLRSHSQYGSVAQKDLSYCLTEAAHEAGTLRRGLSVETIIDTWIHEIGYPLVTVTRSPSGTSATVYQVTAGGLENTSGQNNAQQLLTSCAPPY